MTEKGCTGSSLGLAMTVAVSIQRSQTSERAFRKAECDNESSREPKKIGLNLVVG